MARQATRSASRTCRVNGRNAYDLPTILPGVTNYAPDVQTGSRQGRQIVVNGVPGQSTSYYLDGAYDTNVWRFGGNLLPNPDAPQEFRVLTSNYDAEFGRSAGGVVNAITRSGAQAYHGVLFERLRNNMFNAKPYFLVGSVPPLHQHQFGATLGGSVRVCAIASLSSCPTNACRCTLRPTWRRLPCSFPPHWNVEAISANSR